MPLDNWRLQSFTTIDRDGNRWITVCYWASDFGHHPSDCRRMFLCPVR